MELTDGQIAQKLKERDAAAYEYIIDKYSKQVYYLAYNILHIACTKEDIEECAADVFWEAWTHIHKFDPEKGSFKTWLFMLTKYKALQYKRKLSKPKTLDIDELSIPNASDIEKQLIARQKQEQLIDVIKSFNELDRELFIRRYFYNEKVNDLAEALNLSRPAIDNRLLRGRKIIKEVLSYE